MNTKECAKDWIRMYIENDDEKAFDLDEFERELKTQLPFRKKRNTVAEGNSNHDPVRT